MLGFAHDDKPKARLRRPGAERILAARRWAKHNVSREARRRFAALGIVLVAASILAPTFAAFSPQRTFTVASESMEPTIPKGSLVWTREREPQLGDVVVYESPTGAGFQVHRIVEVLNVYGLIQYVTKGDANDAADSAVVQRDWIVGVVTRDVPYVGLLWLIPVDVQGLVFFVGILVYVGICAWDARALLNGPRFQFTLSGIVVVLLVPVGWGSTTASYAGSAHSFGKVSSPFPFVTGTMASSTIDADLATASVTAASPTLWKETVIWGCTTGSSCTVTAPALSAYATQAGGKVHLDVADFSPTPTFYFEAYMAAPIGNTIHARLIDASDASVVSGSTIITASVTAAAVRSGVLTLSGSKDYQVQIMTPALIPGGTFHQAKLVMSQEYPTKTQTQVYVSGAGTTSSLTSSPASKSFRWTYDADGFDGITSAAFEAIVEVSGAVPTATFTLFDVTANAAVKVLTSSSTSSPTRLSGTFATTLLVDEHEYEVRMNVAVPTLQTATLHIARVHLHQDTFTKSTRYVDLSWPTSSLSPVFGEAGYGGAYEADTEWGDRTGYLEAWMSSSLGQTVSAELYNAHVAASVASSQVDTTSAATTRVRSSLVTLNDDSNDYVIRIKATGGTVNLQHAWLVAQQTVGKTYDHALAVANNVTNQCTWESSLHSSSTSNLARVVSATITLRSDASTASQILVAGGSITQSGGAAVSIVFGDQGEFVVSTRTSSAGSSIVETELRSTCVGYGIRTVQPVTFTFT